MLEELLKYDTELFLFLNRLGNTSWDSFWLIVTEKWSSIPLYILLLILIYKQFGFKTTAITLVAIALMITCTDQLGNLFKHGFKRPRPCQVEELDTLIRYVAKRCGRYGYFSAHAASSMATAVFVSLLFKSKYYYMPFLMLVWAILIGYSRIYLGVHYPLDVITGMAIGGSLGWAFYKLVLIAKTKWITS